MYSVSPFVPAILFTTQAGTTIPTVTMSVTGITLATASDTASAGDDVQLTITLDGTLDPATGYPVEVKPDAATFTIGITRDGDGVQDARTWVDDYGVLHVGESLVTDDVITVTAKSAYVNPSGATTHYTDDVTVTVA